MWSFTGTEILCCSPIYVYSISINGNVNILHKEMYADDLNIWKEHHINGLVQDYSNSSSSALELLQFCIKLLIYIKPSLAQFKPGVTAVLH